MRMREYYGLSHLRSVGSGRLHCPKCGNYLTAVPNGFFHGDLFFCERERKIFRVTLTDVTKKASKEYLDQAERGLRREKLRKKIVSDNVDEVEKVLVDAGIIERSRDGQG